MTPLLLAIPLSLRCQYQYVRRERRKRPSRIYGVISSGIAVTREYAWGESATAWQAERATMFKPTKSWDHITQVGLAGFRRTTGSKEAFATNKAHHVPNFMNQPNAHLLVDRPAETSDWRSNVESPAADAAVNRIDDVDRARLIDLEDQFRRARMLQQLLQGAAPVTQDCVRTYSRESGELGGDLHEVVRLDDTHVSVFLGDATGHDLAANVLANFVRRWLLGADAVLATRRSLDPAAILRRINDHLVRAALTDCQFLSAIHAIYNEETRVLRWARAGAPYPILVRADRPPRRMITNTGPLLGVLHDATFEIGELQLEPGDTVVLHTDGLDQLERDQPAHSSDVHAQLRPWLTAVDQAGADAAFALLDDQLARCCDGTTEVDDVTIVTLTADPVIAEKPESSHVVHSQSTHALSV